MHLQLTLPLLFSDFPSPIRKASSRLGTLQNRNGELTLSQCSKAEQAEIRTSEQQRRAPALTGGFLLLVRQGPNTSFYGGLLAGSLTAGRFLCCGCSKPDSDPRPSIRTESGIKDTSKGAFTMAINTLIRTIGYIPTLPGIYMPTALKPLPVIRLSF